MLQITEIEYKPAGQSEICSRCVSRGQQNLTFLGDYTVMYTYYIYFFSTAKNEPSHTLSCLHYVTQGFPINHLAPCKSSFRMWLKTLESWRNWVNQDITLSLHPPTRPLRVWAATFWKDFRVTRRSLKVDKSFILSGWHPNNNLKITRGHLKHCSGYRGFILTVAKLNHIHISWWRCGEKNAVVPWRHVC